MRILDLQNNRLHLLTEDLSPNDGYRSGVPLVSLKRRRTAGCARTAAIFGMLSGLAAGLLAASIFWAAAKNKQAGKV